MSKTLTFAGVNYLPYYQSSSVDIKEKLRKTNVMNLSIITKGIANAPQEGSEVIYKDGTRFLFGGYITKVSSDETGKGEKFNFEVEVSDYSHIFGNKIASRAYTNKTLAYIVSDLITTYVGSSYGFDVTNVSSVPVIESVSFDHISITKCLEKLANLTNYVWWVDYEKKIYFTTKESTVNPAPEKITDTSKNTESINISYDASQVRNSVTVIGSLLGEESLDTITQTFIGDGVTTSWKLDEYPSTVTSIKLNGVTQLFSEQESTKDTDQFVYSSSGKGLSKGEAGITPSFGDTIEIIYHPYLPIIVTQEDSISIAFFKALEGGDGKKEYVIKDTSISTFVEANNRAKQELDEYSMPLVDGKIVTRTGLLTTGSIFKTGQLLTLNTPSHGLSTDTGFLIQELSISLEENLTETEYKYQITFGGKVIGVGEFLEYLAAQSTTGIEAASEDQILTIEHTSDSMELSDSDVAISYTKQTPPFKYGPSGSPKGVWGLSEWS